MSIVKSKGPAKIERVLAFLASGKSLNRFEAERLVNDHCLHSTMSVIKNRYGVAYSSRMETVPGWNGNPTRVSRYWLQKEARAKAGMVLSFMTSRRGTKPRKPSDEGG